MTYSSKQREVRVSATHRRVADTVREASRARFRLPSMADSVLVERERERERERTSIFQSRLRQGKGESSGCVTTSFSRVKS